ncbi:pectate lyase [Cellulomonas sp. ATA003]|uniref:pectate lyase n=1 Tax=Cellulomonas sp. ATA003 TaxID=3073064 RepID=UPI0028737311|nr:pectate lyase [Cellulomonas sp. ATA003]WNB85181.1 pectate lyase [Cellulomonas sp. ATA003]
MRSGAPTEQFSIAPGSSGRIKLISRASGMALGVVGASKVDGTRLDQAPDTNATHQQWTLVSRDAVTTPAAEPSAAPAPEPVPVPAPDAVPALTLTYLYPLVDPTAGPGAANAGPRQLIGVDPGHSTTPGVVLPSTVCVPSGVEIVRTAGLAEADVPTWILPGSSLPAGVTVASEHHPLEHYGLSSDCGDGTLPEDTTPDEVTPIEPPVSAPAPAPATSGPGTWAPWPTATASRKVSATIEVTGTFDGNLTEYYGLSSGDQTEGQPPMFELADGARIKNVILGVGAGDGIHCRGTCTVENVWWLDVGEDAATFKGTSATQTMTVVGGGARKASDKVFQHNGPGTFMIRDFQVEGFGKLYRSCGNCSKQYARTVVVDDVRVQAPGKSVVGINSNLGDRATLTRLTVVGDPYRKISVCDEYRGVTSGEPTKVASGPSTACGYTASDVTYR